MKITKVSKEDYMGFSWFKIKSSEKPIYKIKALDEEHALKIHLQLIKFRLDYHNPNRTLTV
jgi:hypothetical protein